MKVEKQKRPLSALIAEGGRLACHQAIGGWTDGGGGLCALGMAMLAAGLPQPVLPLLGVDALSRVVGYDLNDVFVPFPAHDGSLAGGELSGKTTALPGAVIYANDALCWGYQKIAQWLEGSGL